MKKQREANLKLFANASLNVPKYMQDCSSNYQEGEHKVLARPRSQSPPAQRWIHQIKSGCRWARG